MWTAVFSHSRIILQGDIFDRSRLEHSITKLISLNDFSLLMIKSYTIHNIHYISISKCFWTHLLYQWKGFSRSFYFSERLQMHHLQFLLFFFFPLAIDTTFFHENLSHSLLRFASSVCCVFVRYQFRSLTTCDVSVLQLTFRIEFICQIRNCTYIDPINVVGLKYFLHYLLHSRNHFDINNSY